MIRILFLLCLAPALLAQDSTRHPFYNGLLEDGKTAMGEADWPMAERLLEIAAFGLMSDRDAMKEICVLQVLIHSHLDQKEKRFKWLSRAKRLIGSSNPVKPENISQKHWDEYLVVIGRKAPPVPKKTADLKDYVQKHPNNVVAWRVLTDAHLAERDDAQARSTIQAALAKHGADAQLLEKALIFSVTRDKERQADDYAAKLIAVAPDNPTAHEYLGVQLVKSKDYEEAEAHFVHVDKARFPRTAASRTQMEAALKKLEDAARRDEERKARELAENQRREKIRLDKKKADDERKARAAASAKKAEADRLEKERARLAKKQKREDAKKSKAKPESQVASKVDPPKDTSQSSSPKTKIAKSKPSKPESVKKEKAKPEATTSLSPRAKALEQIRDLERRVKAKPGDSQLKFQLTTLYLNQGEMTKAKKMLRKLGKTGAKADPLYAENFARYNYLKNDYHMVVETLGSLKNISPETRYYLGMSYYKLQNDEKALSVLGELNPKDYPDLKKVEEAISKRKPLVRKMSKAASRLKELERQKRSGGLSAAERFELIELYLAENNWKPAKKIIERAYRSDPAQDLSKYYYARLHLHEKRYASASRTFYSLAQANYMDGEVFYYGGLAALKNKEKTLSDYMFDRALKNGTAFEKQIHQLRNNKSSSTQRSSEQLAKQN